MQKKQQVIIWTKEEEITYFVNAIMFLTLMSKDDKIKTINIH